MCVCVCAYVCVHMCAGQDVQVSQRTHPFFCSCSSNGWERDDGCVHVAKLQDLLSRTDTQLGDTVFLRCEDDGAGVSAADSGIGGDGGARCSIRGFLSRAPRLLHHESAGQRARTTHQHGEHVHCKHS